MLERLQHKGHLVIDGAMGSNLFQLGLISGDSPELWNVEHPERIEQVHRAFVEGGSDIILTNTFGGNCQRLKLHSLENRVRELNMVGVAVARKCAEGKALVAGSMGPTGELIEPLGALSKDEARTAFGEQAEALAEGGADLLWIETMSDLNELEVAVQAAAKTGLPVAATMSFDTAGKTMMGVSPTEFVGFMKTQPVVAYGANCGVGPDVLLQTIGEMKWAGGENLIAKGNCGIPVFRDGAIRYTGTEAVMANYACEARNLGAKLIGGCCGTTGGHVKAMSSELQVRPYMPEVLELDALASSAQAQPARSMRPRRRRSNRE